MKKKIGIITLYYKNNNYGGVAQAYALNKYFLNLGYESELISYDKKKSTLGLIDKNHNLKDFMKRILEKGRRILKKPIEKMYEEKYKDKLEKRRELLEDFRNSIPHSKVYNLNTISEIEDDYDFFVTGSDQSWNPGIIDEALIFKFLEGKNKNIFSYASSVAVTEVTDRYIEFMRKELNKYKYISVREEQSKDILKKAIDKKIEWVIDPTLLLEKNEWEDMASERLVKEKYIFSYMLGNSRKQRNITKKFAKQKGLKLVTIPYIKDGNKFTFKIEDYKYGDIQMLDITFQDFLSLLKHAEYIVTDSFHAVCFSYIFKKEFYVFEKKTVISTNSRITSLTRMFGISNRIISNEIPLDAEKINYEEVEKNIRGNLKISKEFINNALQNNS